MKRAILKSFLERKTIFMASSACCLQKMNNFKHAKKILLFTFLILGLSVYSNAANDEFVYDKSKENLYWTFLKERLFNGDDPIVSSFQKDIVLQLTGASSKDSMIVNNLIIKLRNLLTNKDVRFLNDIDRSGKNEGKFNSIYLLFNDHGTFKSYPIYHSNKINGNQIFYSSYSFRPEIYDRSLKFDFVDSISMDTRKCYIEYAIVRSLCNVKGNPKKANTFIDEAILSDFNYDPVNTSFSEVDKFVIQKLYSNDFHKQFRKFMVDNFSIQKYLAFTYKNVMFPVAYLACIVFAIFILLISYKPIFKRKYKKKYLSYLVPGILVIFSTYSINRLFNIIAHGSDLFLIVDFARGLLIQCLIYVSITIFFSTVLYFLEKAVIKDDMKFSKQLILKILFIPLIVVLPISFISRYFGGFEGIYQDIFYIMGLTIIWGAGIALALARGALLYFKNFGELELREKEAELAVLKEANSRAELQSLHARINPHFLYNSLNSIAGLVKTNPEKTEKMALSLSDMFRYLINRKNEVLVDVESEIEMVQSYLEIEQIRFGKRLSFSIEIDDELKTKKIPKFILQPMVENAIKHGISKIEGKGEIKITIAQTENWLEIKVADNGPDFSEGLVAGYGLQSLYDLLKICYKNKAEVNWQNSPDKMIIVRIPINEEIE